MKLIVLLFVKEFKRLWNLNDINVYRYGNYIVFLKEKELYLIKEEKW